MVTLLGNTYLIEVEGLLVSTYILVTNSRTRENPSYIDSMDVK